MTTNQLQISLELPESWVAIPTTGSTAAGWEFKAAQQVLRDRLDPAEVDPDMLVLTRHLEAIAADSAKRNALLTAAYIPSGNAPLAALLEVWALGPEPNQPLQLHSLATALTSSAGSRLGDATVTAADLPCGAGIRIRQIDQEGRPDATSRPLTERLIYLVGLAEQDEVGVLAIASWAVLGLGDALAAEVDRVVATMTAALPISAGN